MLNNRLKEKHNRDYERVSKVSYETSRRHAENMGFVHWKGDLYLYAT